MVSNSPGPIVVLVDRDPGFLQRCGSALELFLVRRGLLSVDDASPCSKVGARGIKLALVRGQLVLLRNQQQKQQQKTKQQTNKNSSVHLGVQTAKLGFGLFE